MDRWPIERSWLVVTAKGERSIVPSSGLREWPACGMLGAAGLGKTFEQTYLAELDRADGFEVIHDRLAVLGQTAEGLTSRLDTLAAAASSNTVFYLDALDEVMVPVQTAGLVIQRWVTDKLSSARPRLRLSCRSAVWPPGVQNAIEAVYGAASCAFAVLQPLSAADVRSVVSAHGVDAKTFLQAVDAAGVRALSEQPLTLRMILRIHQEHGTLPRKRGDLFRQGIEQLARERRERAREGTGVAVPTAQLLEAAERLACFCLLSGRDVIDLAESPSSTALAAREVEGLPGADRPLDSTLLDAICRSGLCEGEGPECFRFGHRQFAEYLAGRRLAELLPHQARTLLSAGTTSQSGVAGPLRETAAFAAMDSAQIAVWVTDHDPEVIGLSDVADSLLRRQATLNLLDKFRRHELTDSQAGHDGIELAGFQYTGAEADLGPVLRERQEGCQDVIACAIELIEGWGLSSMSDDLASVSLDQTAPLQNRTSAGYALAKIGSPEARHRLLPLVAAGPDDPDYDLKGLALRCNWPERLSVPALLAALTPPPRSNHHGAYDGFLAQLDHEEFDSAGYRLQGLSWARQFAGRNREYQWTTNLVRRTAIGALDEIDAPGIADALADLILDAAEAHAGSPLRPPHRFSLEPETETPAAPILATKPRAVRHKLIDALAARATKDRELWWTARETPGLLVPDDFPWLIERAVDATLPMPQRENYAELARMLPWMDSATGVETWLRARNTEPIACRMAYPLVIETNSDEAAKARKAHADMKRWNRPRRRRRLRPPPSERIEQVLTLSETKDPRFFLNLCQELTLEDNSTHYGFSRFLTTTPGWTSADDATRARIIESAKRFLITPSDEPERAKAEPLNSILPGCMGAIWLVMARDSGWIESLPTEWWNTWAWYILRELHPLMADEPEEPKVELLRRLHARVPNDVRNSILDLATSTGPETRNLLTSLLGEFEDISDGNLDNKLCDELEKGRVPDDRLGDIAHFVLTRSSDRALSVCLSCIEPREVTARENAAVRSAVALLQERTRETWSSVFDFLRRRPDLAARVLGDFSHGQSIRSRYAHHDDPVGLASLTSGQIGQLVALLIEAFPRETDPHHEGAYFVGPSDSARDLRDRLISWLGSQKDIEAVEALRSLERSYGGKYPWLRRPRARAERSYRLSLWEPIPPSAIAEILAAQDRRLLRSGHDAIEGVIAAIEGYSRRLRHDSPSDLDDLWNQPKGQIPTPKDEERVSDKICVAVRSYFDRFAVAANREVQVFRRKLGAALGGAPGSEVDVLCEVTAAGTVKGEPIKVPIEVKLAHNPEARTGLQDQLSERYMKELGTGLGVYIVVWMGKGKEAIRYRPMWESPDEALAELEGEAKRVMAASSEPMDIRCIVIDASLPLAPVRDRPTTNKRTRTSGVHPRGDNGPRPGAAKRSSATDSPKKVRKKTKKKANAKKVQKKAKKRASTRSKKAKKSVSRGTKKKAKKKVRKK